MLLLDEPSAGLDPSQRVRLWEFVARLAEGGTTVIYSTHQIEEVSHYGDRLVVLADGEAIFDGSFAQLRRAAEPRSGGTDPDPENDFVRYLSSGATDALAARQGPADPATLAAVTGLLIVYPIVLAVLIGLAISRSPEKPRVAFLNQIPPGAGLNLGSTGASARRRPTTSSAPRSSA